MGVRGPSCIFDELGSGLLPDGGIVIVLWGYFDESGTDGALGHTVISGFAAPLVEWMDFRTNWKAGLDADGVDTFHYVACNNRSEDYKGWDYKSQCLPHIERMADILSRQSLVAVSAAHSGDFNAVMDRHPEWKIRFPSAYSLVFELLINMLRTEIYPIHDFEIVMIMSQQENFSERAMEVYRHFKHAGLWPEITHLGYSDPRRVSPLQAADMIAYETRRFCWKEDENYWKQQPFLGRWLSQEKPAFSQAFNDDGLDLFLSQEKGQYLRTPPSLTGG